MDVPPVIDRYIAGDIGTEPGVSIDGLTFSSDYSIISGLVIVLVNTPTCLAGYDHRILENVLEHLRGKDVIVTCTVQPGFCQRWPGVVYNPLFVQIGNVIENLSGVTDVLTGGELKQIHKDFYATAFPGAKVHNMDYLSAEVAKLAMKISFANMIGDALRGHNPDAALEFIGSDPRVGSKCLKYGWGYGGPWFPRDNRALSTFLREVGSYDYLPVAAHESNERHAVEIARHFEGSVIKGACYKDSSVPLIDCTRASLDGSPREVRGHPRGLGPTQGTRAVTFSDICCPVKSICGRKALE